jgi:hypothetical protein
MNYKEHAKENETNLPTGIHTRINNDLRISSIYRRFANPHFESWGWETYLWNGDRIENQYDVLHSADRVVDLHIEILKEYEI